MSLALEALGIFLIICGCVTSTVAKDEGRNGWWLFALTLTGAGTVIVLNF